jgi:hypothetical protein
MKKNRNLQIQTNKILLTFFLQSADVVESTSKLLPVGSIADDPSYIYHRHDGIGGCAKVSDQRFDNLPRRLRQEPNSTSRKFASDRSWAAARTVAPPDERHG